MKRYYHFDTKTGKDFFYYNPTEVENVIANKDFMIDGQFREIEQLVQSLNDLTFGIGTPEEYEKASRLVLDYRENNK